jgi:predicted nuclease with RNAse H fold
VKVVSDSLQCSERLAVALATIASVFRHVKFIGKEERYGMRTCLSETVEMIMLGLN